VRQGGKHGAKGNRNISHAMNPSQKRYKICYVAGREESYSRTRMIIHGLRGAGHEVILCLPPNRSFANYPKLIFDFISRKRGCDLIVVGFYGQLIFPFVRLFTRKPILYDVYISTFDTMVHDRGKGGSDSVAAKFYWWSDALSMRWSQRILLETVDHIHDYAKKFGLSVEKFFHVFLAADNAVVLPKPQKKKDGKFLCHFHGEYAPFHGVKYILKAADILREEDVHFQIIGTGITYEQDMQLARELKLKNCTFIDRVPYEELADYMSNADCCLGIFGENPRTLRVLTNKVIESIAVARPLISARNEPVQELLQDHESAMLVERANPESIAAAILELKKDEKLRKQIAENGHKAFQENCTLEVFARRLNTVIQEMLS